MQHIGSSGHYFHLELIGLDNLGGQTHALEQLSHLCVAYFDANLLIHGACLDNFKTLLERRIRSRLSVQLCHLHGFDLKFWRTILAKHGDHGVEHNLGLVQIGGRTLDENVFRVKRYLAMFAIDYGRQ